MVVRPVLDMIIEAYHDELTADLFYTQLLVRARDYEAVEALAEARRDERRHARMIAALLTRITGEQPAEFTPSPPAFSTFEEGLEKALQGELSDISFYQEIINATRKRDIQDIFWEIRQDEIVHAKKFAALLEELQEENKHNYFDGFDNNYYTDF